MYTNLTCMSKAIRGTRGLIRADSRSGFTVTELIVAMGVFVVIVSIAVGVFVNAVRNQRRLVTLMAVNNNAGGVLEQMAREIRTGYRFCEGQNPGTPCDLAAPTLRFTNHASSTVRYATSTDGRVTRQVVGVDDDPFPLTAEEIRVSYLRFIVSQAGVSGGAADDICNPWRVTVVMGVRPRGDVDTARETRLQTTVSSRVLPAEAPGASESIIRACQ